MKTLTGIFPKAHKVAVPFLLIFMISGFIFSNSAKDSVQSNIESDVIEEIAEPVIKAIAKDSKMSVDYIVRKGAHLFEFCLLGIAVMHTVFVVGERFGRNVVGYGFFCVLMIAVIDEYIQSFSDRTSSVGDILIDFAGACVGFLFVWGIKTIIRLVGVHCR